MRLYFAGAENPSMLHLLVDAGATNVLMSYYYLKEYGIRDLKHWLASERIDYTKLHIYLDCGAFTAHMQGVTIDLQSYINFVKFNESVLTAYSALDDKDSPENTKRNLAIMEEQGLKPVAVYHITMNDWNYLTELCQTHNYVAIGAIAGEHADRSVVERNLMKAISIAKEYKTRYHIYGFTAYHFLAKYPVYSTDSTDWLHGGKTGVVWILDNNRFTVQTLTYHDKQLFRYKPKLEEMGVNYSQLIDSRGWKERNKANIKAILEMNRVLNQRYEELGMRYWDPVDDEELQAQNQTQVQSQPSEEPLSNIETMPNEVNENPNEAEPQKLNGFEQNKGKIQEILKSNPEIEEKRKEKQREWAKTGLAHFKTGKYAALSVLFPDKDYAKSSLGEDYDPKEFYNSIIESVKDFNAGDSDKILEMLNEMIKADIVRAAKNLIYESADGGLQDKNLTTLINNISNRLLAIMALRKPEINISNTIVQTAEEINNTFDENTKQQLIYALRRSIEQSKSGE